MERVRANDGMTLVELLIAMVVMAIGISALVAGFSSGLVAINRGAKASTAGALADQQMEAYRRLSFASIATTATASPSTDCFYRGVVSSPCLSVSDNAYNALWMIDTLASCTQNYCKPSQPPLASNGGSYRIDSYVAWACPITGSTLSGSVAVPACSTVGGTASRPVKLVTIIVRDASKPSKTLVRATSTFDASTG